MVLIPFEQFNIAVRITSFIIFSPCRNNRYSTVIGHEQMRVRLGQFAINLIEIQMHARLRRLADRSCQNPFTQPVIPPFLAPLYVCHNSGDNVSALQLV